MAATPAFAPGPVGDSPPSLEAGTIHGPVHRTLRFQLIAIVVMTVATVLAVSQWSDTRLSERAQERDVAERALLDLRTVASLWGRTEGGHLRRELEAIAEGDRDITAIDIFTLDAEGARLAVTTRDAPTDAPPLGADVVARLRDRQTATTATAEGGADAWRVAMPLVRDGAVVGAALVDVSLAELTQLKHRLLLIDISFFVGSTLIISFALAFFLERRIARPVAALVGGMERAEGGELGARVTAIGSGEFGFLARSFNRMIARLEELTQDLESRVRQATHELAEKNRELELANERLWHAQLEVGRTGRLAALGQMAATIAHELGTPLNSVLGYTQLLLRDEQPPARAEKLEIIQSQVQRMIETIRSVLDRTRDREVRRAPVDIEPLVQEALAMVSSRLAGRPVTMRTRVSANLPPVPADAASLRQVLLNLLTNAIDATEPPGTITVTAELLPPNGRPSGFV